MGVHIGVTLDMNGLTRIIEDAERKIRRAEERSAERVAQGAKQRVHQVRGVAIQEMDISAGPSPGGGGADVVAGYPWRQLEFGTVDTPAFPAFVPAAEVERPIFEREVRDAFLP